MKSPWSQIPRKMQSLLGDRFTECSAELTLLSQCGEHLAEVLSGKTDPLQLLFPGGSSELVEKLYQESPFARTLNALLKRQSRNRLQTWMLIGHSKFWKLVRVPVAPHRKSFHGCQRIGQNMFSRTYLSFLLVRHSKNLAVIPLFVMAYWILNRIPPVRALQKDN